MWSELRLVCLFNFQEHHCSSLYLWFVGILTVVDMALSTAHVEIMEGLTVTEPSYRFEGNVLYLDDEAVPMIIVPKGFWMKAKPVNNFLGAANISHTMARVPATEKVTLRELLRRLKIPEEGALPGPTPISLKDSNELNAFWVSEFGFYKIVLGSKKPFAQPFQDWVSGEVLPTIRRTGRYDIREAHDTEENTTPGMMNPEDSVPSASTARASTETQVQPPKRKRKAETTMSLSNEAVLPSIKFALLAKEASGLSGAPLKRLLYTAGARFMEMMAREHPEMSPQELQRKYRQTLAGSSIEVPPQEVAIAKACIEANLAGSSSTTLPLRGPIRTETTRRRIVRRFRVFEAKSKQHAAAKDAANAEWISLMTQHNCLSGPLAYLDAFVGSGGFKLRTTETLLAAGVPTHRLYSANLDAGIVKALKDKGVHAAVGCWEEALPYDGTPFTGVFLDLCQGSAAQLMGHLAALKPMCTVGCVLGMTIIQRDFDGEPLLMRVARIVDFLGKQGWKLARGGLAPSMLPYRGTVGSTVASIFYILSRM
jgi:prophage antirepressor-like protein